jgi:2'-5' RNA ligase
MAERRLFLALWPDEAARTRMAAAAESLQVALGGRCVRTDGLHLTLAFLGATPESQLARIGDTLADVTVAPMAFRFDHFGYWQPGIGWLGATAMPIALLTLASDVRGALDRAGVGYDRKRFKPHITLLRNAKAGVMPCLASAIIWQCDAFHLVESVAGRYRLLATFPANSAP